MKQEEKEAFLRCVKMRKVAGWSIETTAVSIYGYIQSPFLNKKAIIEGVELFERGVALDRVFRQMDFVRKREILQRKKNIEKKNTKSLVPKILRDVPTEPDLFG